MTAIGFAFLIIGFALGRLCESPTVGKIGTAMFLFGVPLMLVGIAVKLWEVMP